MTEKKCTKIYNARAQPLLCSLNLVVLMYELFDWLVLKTLHSANVYVQYLATV